jgi:hypothetical protein
VIAILALILGRDHLQGFVVIGEVALWVAVAAALVSAFDYFRRFNVIVNRTVDLDFVERRQGDRKVG